MNTNADLKFHSNLNHLIEFDADTLLQAFLTNYNQQNIDWDALILTNQQLEQERDGYKRQAKTQQQELNDLKQEIDDLRSIATKSESVANQSIGLQQELKIARSQIAGLQKQIKELNKHNPAKMKDRIKRQTAKAEENKKRINSQEQVIKTLRHSLEVKGQQLQNSFGKIQELQTQLAHDTGSGLFHKDEHHLIIWPQTTKMQDEDGNIFEGRSLLYLHQSGRGGLMTYNPNTNSVNLCAAPRGGLRPSEELKDFAQNWLFKVNVAQNGIVKKEDMIPVNYNGLDAA
ncbi:TPA: hypothetical protein ACX6RA_003536 [Photobacterium damselae]